MPTLAGQLELSRCPHCSVDNPSLEQKARFETNDYLSSNPRVWAGYGCKRCGGVVFGWHRKGSPPDSCELYPEPDSVDETIPGKAREYLEQALNSIGAPAGAVMLTASAVDAMLKEKGYTDGSLNTRIDQASADGVITQDMAAWAHEVRLDANDQRHADQMASLPSAEDARQSIEFAKALAQFIFVLPSRVSRGIQSAQGS